MGWSCVVLHDGRMRAFSRPVKPVTKPSRLFPSGFRHGAGRGSGPRRPDRSSRGSPFPFSDVASTTSLRAPRRMGPVGLALAPPPRLSASLADFLKCLAALDFQGSYGLYSEHTPSTASVVGREAASGRLLHVRSPVCCE